MQDSETKLVRPPIFVGMCASRAVNDRAFTRACVGCRIHDCSFISYTKNRFDDALTFAPILTINPCFNLVTRARRRKKAYV